MEAVIGSRGVISFDFSVLKLTNVISGGALGVDKLVHNYCISNNIPISEILPNYGKHGTAATHIRNRQIVDSSDIVYAIWDMKSKGTKSVIEYAKKKGKKVIVIEQ